VLGGKARIEERRAVADPEIERIRALLLANPRPPEIAERRRRLNMLGEQSVLPPDVRVEPVAANGVPAEWTSTPAAESSRVLLFLHGGGYVSGSLISHRALVAEAGRQAAARTLAIEYRLAPEHPYPAGLEDALAAYRFLLASGVAPRDIAIGGDSAGGGLTLAMLLTLRDRGEALPGCAWCISPWTDLRMTGPSIEAKAETDPLISRPYLQELVASYLAGASADDPLASPLYGDLRGLPPLLIQVGAAETLLDDSVRLAGAAGAADVPVTLEIYPEMIHVFQMFYQQLGAGRRALEAAGRFIRAVS